MSWHSVVQLPNQLHPIPVRLEAIVAPVLLLLPVHPRARSRRRGNVPMTLMMFKWVSNSTFWLFTGVDRSVSAAQ